MTRQELIERIKRHELQCGLSSNTIFGVDKVVELADGVLAVRETDGEHTIYFDRSKYQVRDDIITDIGPEIHNFPPDTGFIEDVASQCWQDIAEIAKIGLETLEGDSIEWHEPMLPITH